MGVLRFLIAAGVSASALFAMSAPADYVQSLKTYLSDKQFAVNGKFYMYDFNHDGKIARNDWLYIDTASGAAYRLMGKTPTQNDAFGWLPLQSLPTDLDITNPSGYFIFINFPKDQELYGTNAFSWVYVTNGATYKLMGADENHNFDYLDENGDGRADALSGITYSLSGNSILFRYSQAASVPEGTQTKVSCSDEQSVNYGGALFYSKVESWYQGDIVYNCKNDAMYTWSLSVPSITITQIVKTMDVDIRFDNNRAAGTVTIDYKAGSVHNKGTYNGTYFDCYEYYIPPLPQTISQSEHDKLEELMEWEGDGPCDPTFIRTTCPSWYYDDLDSCDINGHEKPNPVEQARSLDADIKTNWNVTDSDGKSHKVYVHDIYKIQ